MHKAIDFGALNSDDLTAFFATPGNVAVLTDIMGIESIKRDGQNGDELANHRKSFRILANYTDRVLILNPAYESTKVLSPRATVRAALVDQRATAEFPTFCAITLGTVNPQSVDPRHMAQIKAQQNRSRVFVAKLAQGTSLMRTGLADLSQAWPQTMVADLRARRSVGPDFFEHAKRHILIATANQLQHQFPNDLTVGAGNGSIPEEVLYWQPFRYSVAMHALAVWWIKNGGFANVAEEKLRNDALDMIYAAYGTFFDGVLTRDKKLREISDLTATILENSFGLKLGS